MSVTLWASAFVGIRAAGKEFGPGQLAAGRLLIGCVVLGVLVALRREPLPSRRELPLIVVCGLLWFALYNVALNAGEQRLDAGTASMIIRIGPILIAVLAGLFLKEGFSRHVFAGGAIALGGTAIIAFATAGTSASSIDGTLLCVVAAVAYAGGVVTEKVVLRRVSALHTVFLCCAVGAVACSPFLPSLVPQAATASSASIAWLAYLGVFPTAIAFTTWAYALARSAAAPLGALAYLGPPISILLAWSMLHETPQPIALAGGATCLAGVAVSRRSRASMSKGPDRLRSPGARPRQARPLTPGDHEMTLQRMDNVLIVVEDLEAAKAFFAELGMELEGETQVEGPSVDSTVGLDGVRADITMMRTPDGHGRVELTKYHTPPAVRAEPENAPANALGIRRIMFAVDGIDDVVARLRRHGAELVGEMAQYGESYRLCFLRGPEGIIIGLAEQLG